MPGISIEGQTLTFLLSMVMGMVLCVIFDVFRIIRIMIKPTVLSALWQDVLFWLIAAVLTYCLLLVQCSGEIRGFVLFGELIGFVLCRMTVSALLIRVASAVIKAIKICLSAIRRAIVIPIIEKVKLFGQQLLKILKFFKKVSQNLKNHLNFKRKVKYNEKSIDTAVN